MADRPDEMQMRDILGASTNRERSERTQELVNLAFNNLKGTRARQRMARDFLAGRVSPVYPKQIMESFARSGATNLSYRSPQGAAIPLKLVGTLSDRWPRAKRDTVGFGRESSSVSARIERAAEGVMFELYNYRQSCDLIGLDCEAATTVSPSVAHWAAPDDQYDYLTPEQWGALDDDLKDLWDWRPGEGGSGDELTRPSGRYRRFARKYRRDHDGKPEWDADYQDEDGSGARPFREDTDASVQAIKESIEERVKSKIPLEIGLWSPEQMAPLNPRFEGDGIVVDGLAIRQSFDGTDLYRRGYRWAEKKADALIPAPSMTGGGAVTLDTLWLSDGDGRPYLIYSVNGLRTWRSGDDGDYSETVDLFDAYGMDFLAVGYGYGLHYAVPAADDRVVPYMEPLIGGLLARDKLMAVTAWHTEQTAWGGWFYKPDPALLAAQANLAMPDSITIQTGKVTKVNGDVMPTVHPGAGPAVQTLKMMIDSDLAEAGINPAAMGGAGATGVTDRAMIQRDEKRGLSMIWNGIDNLYGQTASNANRALACLARKRNEPITLNLLTEVPGDQAGATSTKRSTVVIDADMYGGDYRVKAVRKKAPGDDPATTMMLLQMWKDGAITFDYVAESIGVSDSWALLAQIFAEKLTTSEEGVKAIMEHAARQNADLKELERAKLRSEKLLNEQNVPAPMAAGVAMPPQPQGAPVASVEMGSLGPGGPVPAQQALNASSGAAIGQAQISRVAGVGGDASGLSPGGGGI